MLPPHHRNGLYWIRLAAQSDRLDVQAEIRSAIQAGLIRVVPVRGGGIRIIPSHETARAMPEQIHAPPSPFPVSQAWRCPSRSGSVPVFPVGDDQAQPTKVEEPSAASRSIQRGRR
jgi:hypothetical protein